MRDFEFKILRQSRKSKARLGILKTPHGEVKTPAFIPCGTKATVKSQTPEDLNEIRTQMIFVNTYHMVLSPGVDIIEKAGGIHQFSKINQPIITDSGGFQVFSLGRRSFSEGNIGKNNQSTDKYYENEKNPHLVKISDDGVKFRSPIDGQEFFFTPEFSIEAQKKIGADFIVAFDECTYYKASYEYTKKAMERTHSWARRSLKVKSSKSIKSINQEMYGVIQGGCFEDLRKQSAKFISSLPFFGLSVGGVSVGETKKEMRQQVKWVIDVIGDDVRPRHLLGIGEIDDIIDSIKMGIDTMDCVIPTRHARMGKLYESLKSIKSKVYKVENFVQIDIFKNKYKGDLSPIDENCQCYTCRHFSSAYLHHLFKQRELLGYRLATIHNLYFMERLFEKIRTLIESDKF